MQKKTSKYGVIINSVLSLLLAAPAMATLPNAPITIGMTIPLSGEMKSLGIAVKTGVSIYFDKINATGGISGRKLTLIALDDAYDPLRSAKNVRQLLNQSVFAMISNMGSAPAAVTEPIVEASDTILFAPVTGNKIYRKIFPDRNIFNFRSSLKEETKTLIRGALMMGIKTDQFAFFTQNDNFGNSVFENAMEVLKDAGNPNPERLPYGQYTRETHNIDDALAHILTEVKTPPKAFILAGDYASNFKFITFAKRQFPSAIFLVVSGRIKPTDLKNIPNITVISIELVPYLNSNLPAIIDYRNDLKKYGNGAEPSYDGLEGYLSAKIFVMAMQQATLKHNLTKDGVIAALLAMHNVDIGIGEPIGFNRNDHQALHRVWPVIIKDEQFKPLIWPDFLK